MTRIIINFLHFFFVIYSKIIVTNPQGLLIFNFSSISKMMMIINSVNHCNYCFGTAQLIRSYQFRGICNIKKLSRINLQICDELDKNFLL